MARKLVRTSKASTPSNDGAVSVRVLLVGFSKALCSQVQREMPAGVCTHASTWSEAARKSAKADVIVIDAGEGWEESLLRVGTMRSGLEHCAFIASRATWESPRLREAMEAGICACVDATAKSIAKASQREGERVLVGRLRATTLTSRLRRVIAVSKQLRASRDELMRQVESVTRDMAQLMHDVQARLPDVQRAGELEALLRQEMDVENLLRTTLECLLKLVGSTNAAVFLPGTTGDFGLGAYVNYDCPRDSAEPLLEHLCDVVAPAYEQTPGLSVIERPRELSPSLEAEVGWLADTTMAVYSCREDGECIGVLAIFRDQRSTYTPEQLRGLALLGSLFGRQLSRVVKTHNRHKPKDSWGVLDRDDDADMAA